MVETRRSTRRCAFRKTTCALLATMTTTKVACAHGAAIVRKFLCHTSQDSDLACQQACHSRAECGNDRQFRVGTLFSRLPMCSERCVCAPVFVRVCVSV